MSEVVFTMPGKAGDAIHQFPVVYHWAKQTGQRAVLWLDQQSCAMVAPLFAAQPCVERVEFKKGIESYHLGGQPFHFDLPTSDYEDRTVYHLGLRSFPERQLTQEALVQSRVPVTVDAETLASESQFVLPPADEVNRVVLHGQAVCPHNHQSPDFWRFLHRIRDQLPALFQEIAFVGSERDLEVARGIYPDWIVWSDGGDFLRLAQYLASSRCFIGCGSSPAALAQWLKIPCIRVHDPVANNAAKRIWDGLGEQQINETELALRTQWPRFRDRWLRAPVESP